MHTVKGQVTIEGGEPEMPLHVLVESGNLIIAGFRLAETGRFDHEIKSSKTPDAVKITAYDKTSGYPLTDYHTASLSANGTASYQLETDIPWDLVNRWGDKALKEVPDEHEFKEFLAKYHVKGRVVTRTADKTRTVGVPNARVELLEYDPQRRHWWRVPGNPPGPTDILWPVVEHRDTLGVAWTDADGNFDYTFYWPVLHFETWPPQPIDRVPDLVVRVSQQLDGRSVELLESEPFMSLKSRTTLKDLEVPMDKLLVFPNPDPKLSSNTNQGFQAIGLLPVDNFRIQDGYANSQPGDLVQCKNAPFGGVLELYAFFKDPKVTHYRLNYAPAGTTDFEEISNGLRNYVWDAAKKMWKGRSLGPFKVGKVENLYRDIEQVSTSYLYSPKIKVRWNTQALKPGKYTVRIEGFHLPAGTGNAQPVSSAVYTLPPLRIDNVRPRIDILGVYKQGETKPQSECGIIDLKSDPKQPLRFKILVQDPEGHLGSWHLNTLRGRNRDAGSPFATGEDYRTLQNTQIFWAGPGETEVVLPLGSSGTWKKCAYAFHLYAVGRSTDGRSSYLRSQEAHFQLNTYIDGA